jgi:hypothetical protein
MKRPQSTSENVGRMRSPAKGQRVPSGQVDVPIEKPTGDAEYWQSRVGPTKNELRRYKQNSVRDHFMKIAAGYDELAQRAREFGIKAQRAERTPREVSTQAEGAHAPRRKSIRGKSDVKRLRMRTCSGVNGPVRS